LVRTSTPDVAALIRATFSALSPAANDAVASIRRCEEPSDEAIHSSANGKMDCFAPLDG
jgi:hypothetical protein